MKNGNRQLRYTYAGQLSPQRKDSTKGKMGGGAVNKSNAHNPGGVRQSGPSNSSKARESMIKRNSKPNNGKIDRSKLSPVKVVELFRKGELSSEEAYDLFLAVQGNDPVTPEEAYELFTGGDNSKGARDRMLARKGIKRDGSPLRWRR